MMSKAIQLSAAPLPGSAARASPPSGIEGRDGDGDGDGNGRAVAPPAYESLPRGSRTYGYTSLLD